MMDTIIRTIKDNEYGREHYYLMTATIEHTRAQ